MTTTDDGARAGEIERRVVDWATATLATVETADGVEVRATASRTASLPDDGLEVRPEDWTVALEVRLSDADEGRAADVLGAVAEATAGTVTLDGGEAAEIAPIAGTGAGAAERVDDAPEDKPLRVTTSVSVTIPWPSRNDAAAESA
jgi:hypothetical protein